MVTLWRRDSTAREAGIDDRGRILRKVVEDDKVRGSLRSVVCVVMAMMIFHVDGNSRNSGLCRDRSAICRVGGYKCFFCLRKKV